MTGPAKPRRDGSAVTAVQPWLARLSEGWCPREGHPALQVRDDFDGAGYCAACIVGWTLSDASYGQVLSCLFWDLVDRRYARQIIDPFELDQAVPGVEESILGEAVHRVHLVAFHAGCAQRTPLDVAATDE